MNHIKEQFFPNTKNQRSRALYTVTFNNVLIAKQTIEVSNSLLNFESFKLQQIIKQSSFGLNYSKGNET